jgi:plastocyanin domain-containing protein
MSGFMGILSYGIGTLVGFALIGLLVFWFVQDITQKKHTVRSSISAA